MKKRIIFNDCQIGDEVYFIDLKDMKIRKGEVKDIIHTKNTIYYEIDPDIGDHVRYMQVVFKTLYDCSRFCVCAMEALLHIQEDVEVVLTNKEPKFKVGDTVYYYDYNHLDVIKKDEIVRIEYDNNIDMFHYYFKNTYKDNDYYENEIHLTFEECKSYHISFYETLLRGFQSRMDKDKPDSSFVKSYKERLEKIKEQVEVK